MSAFYNSSIVNYITNFTICKMKSAFLSNYPKLFDVKASNKVNLHI